VSNTKVPVTASTPKDVAAPEQPAKPAPKQAPKQPQKSKAQIEADIAATRARLAATVDELVDKAHPKNVAKRQVEQAKAQVYDEQGNLRTQKLMAVGGAVAGTLGVLLVIRGLVARRARRRAGR
jgi:hypothetical protein